MEKGVTHNPVTDAMSTDFAEALNERPSKTTTASYKRSRSKSNLYLGGRGFKSDYVSQYKLTIDSMFHLG